MLVPGGVGRLSSEGRGHVGDSAGVAVDGDVAGEGWIARMAAGPPGGWGDVGVAAVELE